MYIYIDKMMVFRIFFIVLSAGFFFGSMDRAVAGAVQESAPIVIEPSAKSHTGIDNALNRVLAYFTPVHGEVERIEDGTIWIRVTGQAKLVDEMRFSVFREGGVFRHPVTNDPIGTSEKLAGRIELRDDAPVEGLFPCTIVTGDINPKDKIRITSSKIKLAFFQDRSTDWAVSELFYDALRKSGRFEVLEAYTSTYDRDTLTGLARNLGAAAVLMFSTSPETASETVKIKLYWTEDSKMFSSIEEPLNPEDIEMTPEDTTSLSRSTGKPGLQKIYELDGGSLFAVGDTMGNGNDNVVIGDGNKVLIYSVNDELQEIWSVKGPRSGNIMSIDILDVNRNGRPEIFVTALVNQTQVRSFVIEYDRDRGYQKVMQNISYMFRVKDNDLLMQKFGRVRTYSGPVYEGEWRDGKYRKKSKLKLPEDVNIYGFTSVDWEGTGQLQLVSINDNGLLKVYNSEGRVELEIDRSFGKPEISFNRELGATMEFEEWFVRGRLMTVSTGKGEALVVINRVPAYSVVPSLGSRGGEVYVLWRKDGAIHEKLVQKEIPGSITDYLIKGDNLFLISKGSTISKIKNIASGKSRKNSLLFHITLALDEFKSDSREQKSKKGY